MIRDAALYGLWAAICTGLTAAPFALEDLAGQATAGIADALFALGFLRGDHLGLDR